MIDQMYDRHYQTARGALNKDLSFAVERIATLLRRSFEVLNRIEYSAPWTHHPRASRNG